MEESHERITDSDPFWPIILKCCIEEQITLSLDDLQVLPRRGCT